MDNNVWRRALGGVALAAMYFGAHFEKQRLGRPAKVRHTKAPSLRRKHRASGRGHKKREIRAKHVAAVKAQQGTPKPAWACNGSAGPLGLRF